MTRSGTGASAGAWLRLFYLSLQLETSGFGAPGSKGWTFGANPAKRTRHHQQQYTLSPRSTYNIAFNESNKISTLRPFVEVSPEERRRDERGALFIVIICASEHVMKQGVDQISAAERVVIRIHFIKAKQGVMGPIIIIFALVLISHQQLAVVSRRALIMHEVYMKRSAPNSLHVCFVFFLFSHMASGRLSVLIPHFPFPSLLSFPYYGESPTLIILKHPPLFLPSSNFYRAVMWNWG